MHQPRSLKHLVATITGLCTALATALRWHAVRIAVVGGLTLCWLAGVPAASAAGPCCSVTSIDKDGQITARETRGARTFEFQVEDRALLRALRVGAPVYANFNTRQVSLDGKKPCCTMENISTAERKPVPGANLADRRTTAAVSDAARAANVLPQLSFGTPRKATKGDDPRASGPSQNVKTVRLRGINDLREVNPNTVPEAAKDMLLLNARALETQEFDGYIVIPESAQEWSKTLPKSVREKLRKAVENTGKKKKKKGCSTRHISMGCMKNEVDEAVDDVAKTARKAWKDIEAEWGRAMGNVTAAATCFKENTLEVNTPVKFSETPEFPVNVNGKGVKGTVAVGVPVAGDFTATLKFFYIPCMPFALRPKSLGAEGVMEAGGLLRANLTLSGEISHKFLVPPGGGVKIPAWVIPIVIGHVPIAEVDVSVFVEGNVTISGKGTLNGEVKLQSTQRTAFDFACSGHGCDLRSPDLPPTPATAVESIKLEGTVHVKPAIYTALQLSLDWNLLESRAGPQPLLLGELYGCAAASGTQTSSGASTSQTSYSAVADLDWGLDIRAEALAANKMVAHKKLAVDVSRGTSGKNAHLYFKDLAQSTGLVPVVTGASKAVVGQPAGFMFTMPKCYPYRDAPDNALEYRVTWTGGASASAGAPAAAGDLGRRFEGGLTRSPGGSAQGTCTFQGGQGTCHAMPKSATAFNLTWPASGNYVLTVTPVDDKHGHKFDASRAKQVNIQVQQ